MMPKKYDETFCNESSFSDTYKSRIDDNIGINILDYLEILAKNFRMITKVTSAAFVLSIIAALMLPNYYSSTARIIPPHQDNGLMGMMMGSMGGGVASLAGDLLGKGSPADMYVGMLHSHSISDKIIDRFKLMNVYGEKYRIDAYRTLDKQMNIVAGKKDGIISITVEDKDPKRAAEMANAYVEELAKLIVSLSSSDAGSNRVFLEERLAKAKDGLASAEDALKDFQSKNKALDISEQAKGTIKGVAELEGQLAIENVKLAGIKRIFTDSSQEVKNQQAVVANIRGQINKFEGMRSGYALPGVGSVPETGRQYVRLMREFKIQETLVELLTKQYEISKLTEAKDISSIQVLQTARVPDKKIKPKRSIIVLVSTAAACLIAIFWAFICEAGMQITKEERLRLKQIISMISGRTTQGGVAE